MNHQQRQLIRHIEKWATSGAVNVPDDIWEAEFQEWVNSESVMPQRFALLSAFVALCLLRIAATRHQSEQYLALALYSRSCFLQ